MHPVLEVFVDVERITVALQGSLVLISAPVEDRERVGQRRHPGGVGQRSGQLNRLIIEAQRPLRIIGSEELRHSFPRGQDPRVIVVSLAEHPNPTPG